MVKLLVAGAEGGLGRAFLSRLPPSFEGIGLGRAAMDVARLNDVMARVQEIRPDVIVNGAGFTDIDACEVDRWRAVLVNRYGARHLAEAAAKVGALLIQPSTHLIFDGDRPTPYREEDPPNPLSTYGDSKLAGELAVMSAAPRHLILRTGTLFGPFGRNYVNDLISWRGVEPVVFAAEEERTQPTYQLDFVDAALELVRRGQTGVWNVASTGAATPLELARVIYQILGDDVTRVRSLEPGDERRMAPRPKCVILDGTKLAALGLRLRPWGDALREFLGTGHKQ